MRALRDDRSRPWRVGALVFAIAFWVVDLTLLRAGVPDALDDTWEYGVVARALLWGDGFRTLVVHPPLWSLRDAQGSVPLLVHGPLLPVLLAPFVGVFGAFALDHVAWLAALFAVLAAVAIARLGERLTSPPVGAAAAALFTLSPLTIRAVHHDVALLAGAWTLAFSLEHLVRTRPAAARAGVALGIGALARPEFLLAAPVLVALAKGVRARFALAFGACVLPWAWHGIVHAGSPWFNLSSYLLIGYWAARPEISVMRDFDLPPRLWSRELLGAFTTLPAKWLDFAPHALKRALAAPTGTTGWLALLGWLTALQSPRVESFARAAFALALIPIAIMTATLYDARYLVPFVGLWALGAARGANEITEWLPWWLRRPRAWFGATALLVLPATGPALNEAWREARVAETRLAAERAALGCGPGRVARAYPRRGMPPAAYSDTPDFVAWTTQRSTVWLTREEYAALPAAGDTAAARTVGTRPVRSAEALAWFHTRDGRGELVRVP